ncbi:pectinesterase 3-like [Euphorbia lathyris]|uniref:pectinesterase 3-like n=1 Tax=Euphorbia lathyris TaxID=212925 RepID=UPI0033132C3C
MASPENSVMSYGKVDDSVEQEQSLRRSSRKRMLIMSVSGIVLAAIVIAGCIGLFAHTRNNTDSTPNSTAVTPSSVLEDICNATRFRNSCIASISQFEAEANTTNPQILFNLSLIAAINELSKLQVFTSKLITTTSNSSDEDLKSALEVCEEVLDDAFYRLNDSISSNSSSIDDLRTWITAILTDQETCLDALREMKSTESHLKRIDEMKTAMKFPSEFASNSLAIATRVLSYLSSYDVLNERKLLGTDTEFPSWVSLGDRRLLEEVKPVPNLTVAKDGSGDFATIGKAVRKIPRNSTKRFVIYVKEGVYDEEYVQIKKSMWNLMLYGDSKDKTVISGGKNCKEHKIKTFHTATFGVSGKGFIGRDIRFINTAGPENGQAVAFRSDSDQSVCYKCAFEAFQDTFYLHSGRQFYRDCDIIGTVDFIFGNAAAVLQNCRIMPRQPMENQSITITAQGKNESNQTSGFSIQNCTIFPLDGNVTARTYLGRPWKDFSTTVVIHSHIHSFLDPSGWSRWNSSEPPRTIYYGEFENFGEGSAVDRRVNWTGYKPSLTAIEAERFSVKSFIKGEDWLPATSVPFNSNL